MFYDQSFALQHVLYSHDDLQHTTALDNIILNSH